MKEDIASALGESIFRNSFKTEERENECGREKTSHPAGLVFLFFYFFIFLLFYYYFFLFKKKNKCQPSS
jgi:hypothetical protein